MIDRRKVLAGLAGLGASIALPAWAQAIRSQSDPYAQVDPYADPRNGFSSGAGTFGGGSPRSDVFERGPSALATSRHQVDEEIGMGVSGLESFLEKKGGPHPDRAVQQAMAQFMGPFVKVSDRPELPWEFVVNRIPQFQALAWAGGKITVFPHVIAVADRPGELAAIMTHEMGHSTFSHSYEKQRMANMLERTAEKGRLIDMQKRMGVAGMSAVDAMMKSYGRENEFEADAYIITMFERVGIHPADALSMYAKMMQYYKELPNEDNSLFSTHPGTMERMERLADAVRMLPPPGKEVTNLPGWGILKAKFPTPSEYRSS